MYSSLLLVATFVANSYGDVVIPQQRIYGGENAKIEDFPYQVSVVYTLIGGHICGGSILSSRVVISAAHCFGDVNTERFLVQYGSTYVDSGKTVKIDRIVNHKEFNEKTIQNDIAILHLAEDIEFGQNVQPIALAGRVPTPGTKAVLSGWGRFADENPNPSHILQKLNVLVVDQFTCSKFFDKINITDQMICAGILYSNKGACRMDSGGPLVANNELIGIVSFGGECGSPQSVDVYTNVATFLSWIDEVTHSFPNDRLINH